MKKIAILGSTGSIGTQALDIIEKHPEKYKVSVLSGATNIRLLSEQIDKFNPEAVAIPEGTELHLLKSRHPKTEFLLGLNGLVSAASQVESDLVLNALVGMIGLLPTHAAILAGKDIALANKETLVSGGEIIMKAAAEHGVQIIPVDSEHSAIFQCLSGNHGNPPAKLIITASGGPFRGLKRDDLKNVSVEEALNHPKWKMGSKISIDSATLMNKGLEVIEAHWLFDMPGDQIEVIVHPQSIIHSMVEFKDHSVIAQLGMPDMRIPISYAFAYPDRLQNHYQGVDFAAIGEMTFEEPDKSTFRCLQFAYNALAAGGSYSIVLNSANEELVRLFLEKKIDFLTIQDRLDQLLQEHQPQYDLGLEEILEIDKGIRERVNELCL